MSESKDKAAIIDRSLHIGLAGIAMIAGGILWVFLRPEGTMFGVAEVLAILGMFTVMGAAYSAAVSLGEGDDRDRRH